MSCKHHRAITLWIVFCFTCVFSGVAFPQDAGRITGQIHIIKGDFPPRPILVELQLRGATINSAYADNQGRFGFYQLESNPYHIIVNDDDYYPVDELANLNLIESQFAMAQIYLRPREKKTADPLGKQTAGSNPYIVDPGDYNQRFPKKAVKEYEKGLESEKKDEKDKAIAHYEAALKIAPDYYPAHNNLGTLYMGKSDFKLAEEQFREAVHLDQNEAQAYFNLSNVLMLTERLSEAESTLAAGLQRRPDSAFGNFLQGCLYVRMGKFTEAESSLQNALRLDSKMPQAYLQLVNLYLRQNRREDAITQLQAFLKGFPSAPASPKAQEILNRLQKEESAEKR
ncbi:MAG: tetratricopeptide repeat protein [Terriglobales bacterium]